MAMRRVGILTFHHSYNCGSMMQAYALQTIVSRMGYQSSIINFSNAGQKKLYETFFPVDSLKNVVKNVILLPRKACIERNNDAYKRFITDHFELDGPVVRDPYALDSDGFDVVIAGSDQIWNITIEDGDDAYFLPWVKDARKVAYAPSFGAKNPMKYSDNPQSYASYLKDFNAVSVRERNGQRWIRELAGLDAPVVLDPTLLLDACDYSALEQGVSGLPERYIFYYSPGYSADINRLVERVSRKYELPVVAFNAKHFYLNGMNFSSKFLLPSVESPATYLSLIKNASVVFTTSFHGTIFSTVYRKPFWTVKNGGMFGDDDRVLTLAATLGLEDRLCPIVFDDGIDYLSDADWASFEGFLSVEREKSMAWLSCALAE